MNVALTAGQQIGRTGDVPILMYHSVAVESTPRFRSFVVHPDEFAEQMAYLDANGYHPTTAAKIAEARSSDASLPPNSIVLTFDDAYADFHANALPVLQKYGFPATIYVPTAYVGATARWLKSSGEQDRALLSWQALYEIATEGIEIASHSHSHLQLDREPDVVVRDELHRSRCLLEDSIGLPIKGFAYPFGYWGRAARAAVADTGYRYACAVSELITTPSDNSFALPRLSVNAGIGTTGLAQLLASQPTRSRRHLAAVKRIIWHALRAGTQAGGDP
jgi:peptidoglycan/xylan/chitin deacetylase (PgdA/CDA1 family)